MTEEQTAVLRERIEAALREHYLSTNRDEADADGNLPCRCGWRDPGPMGSDEGDWDSHLAAALLPVVAAEVKSHGAGLVEAEAELGTTSRARDSWYRKAQELRKRAERAEAAIARALDLLEREHHYESSHTAQGIAVLREAHDGTTAAGADTAAWTAVRAVQLMNEAGAKRDAAEAAVTRVRAECDRIEAAVRDNPQGADFDGAYLACLCHVRAALDGTGEAS